MRYTILGKVKGAKYCEIKDNEIKARLSRILSSMITRCYNPKHKFYKNYGGKGITICDEWTCEKGLDNFYDWAISNGYYYEKEKCGYSKLSIDRIDNDKGYSPDNCRWATRYEQNNNRKNSIIVEYNGEKDTLKNFCKKLGLDYHAVFLRIYRRKWTVEKALSIPINKDYQITYNGTTKTPTEWANIYGIHNQSFMYHFKKGTPIEEILKHFGKI